MPGRLVMDQPAAGGFLDLKKDRSQAQEKRTDLQSHEVQLQATVHANGPNGVLTNGVPAVEPSLPITNGDSSMTGVEYTGTAPPPPLDQSWRQSDSYKSLGTLLDRIAQTCYRDLNTTLTEMSQRPVQTQQQRPNGIVPHVGEDTDRNSLEKKRLLLDFADVQRDRFVKAFIMSQYAQKNSEDMSRVIDLNVWEGNRKDAQFGAMRAIAQTGASMMAAQVPAPNIEGAMELLATGKASWMPDRNYIPPKLLSAKQLLKTLRNMNVILATRLSLDEDLPPHFQDFSIADGRATFTVRNEFEVDLSVADEDPATPFYFIDIRLLFTPASNVLDDRLRGFMEAKVNQELATKGLKGCYDFLHNFVITHKINVLRSQAGGMVRGKWFDCIRTENMRRNCIVQYWAGMPGPKSWIEIGISSGKGNTGTPRRPATPCLSVRWYRRGVEVKDETLDFDWQHLDLESLETGFCALAGLSSSSTAKIENIDLEDEIPALVLNQPALRTDIKVRIEPVTGQFSITPPLPSTAHAEWRLNSDSKADPAKRLAWLVCTASKERLAKTVELLGWSPTAKLIKQDNLQKIFGEAVPYLSVYTPSRAWGSEWALAVNSSLSGQKWWVVSLAGKTSDADSKVARFVASARHISQKGAVPNENPNSRDALRSLERQAVNEVTLDVLSKQLQEMQVPCHMENPTNAGLDVFANLSTTHPAAMLIRFSLLMKPEKDKAWKPWATDPIRLTHHGLVENSDTTESDEGSVRHEMRITLVPQKLKSLYNYLVTSKDSNLSMNASGGLSVRFLAPFGQPFVDQIKRRLAMIERLDRCLTILQQQQCECTELSFARVAFAYNEAPELGAQLVFSRDGDLPVRLKLLPPGLNPHQRIRVLLEQALNGKSDSAFDLFVRLLKFSLPVMQAFEQIERNDAGNNASLVHLRRSDWYVLKYRSPLPSCELEIRVKDRIEGKDRMAKWAIELTSKHDSLPDGLLKALKQLWQTGGEHWEGLGNSVVAATRGVRDAVLKIDEVVRRFEGSEVVSTKPKEEPKPESHQQAQAPALTTAAKAAQSKPEPDVIMLD